MAVFIKMTNPPLEDFEETAISKRALVNDTVLDVFSGLGFKTNQILLIGNYGEENAEIVKTHSTTPPTDTQITLSAGIKFSHSENTPIRVMPFDKFRIYQSTDGGQTYSLVDTIDIRPDKAQTVYLSTATTGTKFKIASYNSITQFEGSLSDAIDAAGLDFAVAGNVLDRVYDLYNDPQQKFITSDEQLLVYLNEGILDLWVRMTGLGQGYGVKRTGTTEDLDISLVAGQSLYDFPSDMIRPIKVAIDYTGNGYFVRAKKYDVLLVDNENYFSENEPAFTLYHNKIEINPKPKNSNGKIRLWYVYIPQPLTSITDKPKLPAVDLASKILVDFCIARIYEKAYKTERASYFLQAYENGVTAWLNAIAIRDKETKFIHSFAEDLENGFNIIY